jgi:hypothetical protein
MCCKDGTQKIQENPADEKIRENLSITDKEKYRT